MPLAIIRNIIVQYCSLVAFPRFHIQMKFVQLHLYGGERLTNEVDKKLLKATLKFIRATERRKMLHRCKLPYISTYLFVSVLGSCS